MIDARHATGDMAVSRELVDLRWFPIGQARELEIPMITRKILFHIEELITDPPPPDPHRPIPYFKHTGDRHVRIDE